MSFFQTVNQKPFIGLYLATFLLIMLYLGFVLVRPAGYFWSIDEGGKFFHMRSILETGDLKTPLIYPYRHFDPQAEFPPFYYRIPAQDQFYSWWPPGLPLVSIPFYKLFGFIGLYILPVIAGGITALLAGLITHTILPEKHGLAILSILVTGLATPIAFYSQMFWEHTLSMAFFLAALYLILLTVRDNRWRLSLLAGILGAIAVFFRLELVIILFGFGLVLLIWHWRLAIPYGVGFISAEMVFILVNLQIADAPFGPTATIITNVPALGAAQTNGLWFFPRFLFNFPLMYAMDIGTERLVLGTILFAFTLVLPFFKRLRIFAFISALGLFLLSFSVLISPIGYRGVNGFLLVSPHIIIGVWCFAQRGYYKDSIFPRLLLGAILIFGLIYLLRMWETTGGLQWGQRYSLAFYPMLVIASITGIAAEWADAARLYRWLIAGVYIFGVLVGVGYELRGIASVNILAQYAKETEKYLPSFADRPALITCDINALVPNIYWEQPLFSILLSDIQTWNEHAQEIGIQEFYRLSFDLCFLNNIDEIYYYRQKNPSGIRAELCSVKEFLNGNPEYCQQTPIPID